MCQQLFSFRVCILPTGLVGISRHDEATNNALKHMYPNPLCCVIATHTGLGTSGMSQLSNIVVEDQHADDCLVCTCNEIVLIISVTRCCGLHVLLVPPNPCRTNFCSICKVERDVAELYLKAAGNDILAAVEQYISRNIRESSGACFEQRSQFNVDCSSVTGSFQFKLQGVQPPVHPAGAAEW